MDDIISILRMVERLLVVGFAGLSIYLGYRLFFQLPSEEKNEGTFELPGIKIVLTKVGPGVFFSVFGSLILFQSLHEKIELTINDKADVVRNQSASQHFLGATASLIKTQNKNKNGLKAKRAAIIEQVGELNCSLKILESLKTTQLSDTMKIAFHDAKVALLTQVWEQSSWGDIEQFIVSPDSSKIHSIFNDTSVACPYG